MKEITKLGLSALCGSLAAITAANAGSVDVKGSAHATWTSLGNSDTGNPFGMKTNLSFIGTGELDGGQDVKMSVIHTDKAAWSAAELALTTNNIGTFALSGANGGGLGNYDDKAPTAWEETWDAGISTSVNLQKGVGSSTHVSWASPKMAGGTQFIVAYTPQNDGAYSGDKATSGAASNQLQEGVDVVLDIAPDGPLNIFMGYSQTFQDKNSSHYNAAVQGDHEEATAGIKWSVGPLAAGVQVGAENMRPQHGPGLASEISHYVNTSWGVALNINDGLSLSYGEARSQRVYTTQQNSANGGEFTPKQKMKGSSIQAGYTIGGVTLKYADTTYDNVGYTVGNNKDAQVLSMGIAF